MSHMDGSRRTHLRQSRVRNREKDRYTVKFSITKRGVATPIVALVAVAAFAGIASAAPSVTLQRFGPGDVEINGTSATLTNDEGQYSGVYLKSKSLSDKPLAAVDFSFKYSADSTLAGGAPRFSIPLNTGSYAFLDALNCGTPSVVSTELGNCPVFINTGGSYANWDTLAAEHPELRIASGKIPFVIADQAGTYKLSDIVLR
jgi:hypothetical protein